MVKSVLFIFCVIFLLINDGHAAKILAVFPIPSVSHQVVFRPLTQELARRGHELTIITTDPIYTPENRPKNFTEIDVHDVSYNVSLEFLNNTPPKFGYKSVSYEMMESMSDMMEKIITAQLQTKEVQKLVKEKKTYFNLLIIEAFARPYIAFSHVFRAPVIQISSIGMTFGIEEIVGAPMHPFLYPSMTRQKIYNLSFWDKLSELYLDYYINKKWAETEIKAHNILEKFFGSDLPSLTELSNNVDMLFLNTHPLWSNRQPVPPNVVNIWGIYKKPIKSLPEDLQTYLDSSKNGVIYMSFGSNVPSILLPPEKRQSMINVFSRLPYDVLWKWESDELPGKSKNIKISKWFPQSDVLRHPKIKLFITQGGLQSTDEAISAGVPLIGIPMMADQWYNVEHYKYHKIGTQLDLETLEEDKFERAIFQVINDTSYRENILRLRTLMADQPEGALQRAVWWSEYVLRHSGAKHLRAAGANLSFVHYYELEFLLKLLLLVSSLCGATLIGGNLLYKKLKSVNVYSKLKHS